MPEYTVNIVERPRIRTAGLKVRTTMAKVSEDCPKIWQDQFGPRMESFPADPAYPCQYFGVSVMLDESAFDYWAIKPIAEGTPVPEGMDVFTIPGGLYAECHIASLADLGPAFMHIYGEWIAGQDKYALNMQGASYELYTSDYLTSGRLSVYCPLTGK